MTLAREHHWTPEQVDRMDPDFIDELFIQAAAQSDHELFSTTTKDVELMKKQDRRRIELRRWRESFGEPGRT